MRKFLIAVVLIGLAVLGYSIYLFVDESRFARRVTIVVQTPDRMPIPHTMILLKATYEDSSVQSQTNERGQLHFRKLTPGMYYIRATQVWCDGGMRGAQTIGITIQGSNNLIHYFPCG